MEEVLSAGGKRPFQDERELWCLGGFGMIIRAEEPGVKVSEGSPRQAQSQRAGRWPWGSRTRACGALAPFALESLSP